MTSLSALCGIRAAELLRQDGNMLMLDSLIGIDENGAICTWSVSSDSAFYVPGQGVPGYAAIECMAQCIAALAGAKARIRGLAPPLGLLLGTRQFRSHINWMRPGHLYQIECQELMRDERGMASFDCKMLEGDVVVANCRLTVYEKELGKSLADV